MWDYVQLPLEPDNPGQREKLIEQEAVEKMRAYNGMVFLCVSRSDQERRLTFRQAARALGYQAMDELEEHAVLSAMALARCPKRNVLFVEPSMQPYLEAYLDACPAGLRHVLFYSRRRGNGPSPYMSAFMDFWLENGVDIWDLWAVDKKASEKMEPC